MKALFIDAAARTITVVEHAGLPDLQRMVGGYIKTGWTWDTGDVLFVDEEGLFKPQANFFMVADNPQPLAGNGVVVGKERYDHDGEYLGTDDPAITVEQLTAQVRFRSRAQADAWGKANASEPASSIIVWDKDGIIKREVFARYGSVFADIPRPADEEGT